MKCVFLDFLVQIVLVIGRRSLAPDADANHECPPFVTAGFRYAGTYSVFSLYQSLDSQMK